ncbi:exodeoxyribonuclease V subunit gamma [Calidifontibacter terrae]
MALVLHRSDHPEALADGLAAMLRAEPLDVFAQEWIVAPTRGVERWLAQRISHTLGARNGSDGVAAGIRFFTPASLASLLLDRDRDDPWSPDRLVWPVLTAIDECCGKPGFEALTAHLGAGDPESEPEAEWQRLARHSRRYAVARRIAGLFASYARERPTLLAEWEAGSSAALPDDLRWEPPLWRETLAAVESLTGHRESPVQRHERVVAALRAGSSELALPQRVSLFGHTRLSVTDVELLTALGDHHDVHLWLPHPSPGLWSALATTGEVGASRADDRSATLAHHPLLATLGRDVRELQQVLQPATDLGVTPSPRVATYSRLSLLQNDIRANVPPDPSRSGSDDDLSVQVHACHGPTRQVEVLREVLTALFENDHTLAPRDVLVMCPDVERFAPLIRAAFDGAAEWGSDTHPGRSLRVQLADRALAASNPLVDLAHRVVALVAGRMTASEILDLAAHETVARRFGFDEEDLDLLAGWIKETAVRWGLDSNHRGEYGLRAVPDNTWAGALDRLALGVAVAEDTDGSAGELLPVDAVGSNDIATVGRFLELMARIERAAARVRSVSAAAPSSRGRLTASEWTTWLRETVDDLAASAADQPWQVEQLGRELAAISDAAGDRISLRLADVRVMLEQRWSGRPSRANFRTGAVTVCTMVPMRSVPHRVVVVLGVDDGVYPRSPITDGDDVLARAPRVGERDLRSEDRQLLLDAVMAAGDTFVAIYSGFDEHTGLRRPPAVPLQELISAASSTVTAPGGSDVFLRHHTLQTFDDRNFDPSIAAVPGGSFDRAARDAALALRRHRADPAPIPSLMDLRLSPRPTTAVTLEELRAFFDNPAREFLRRRLDVTVAWEADEVDDSLPIELDSLEQWAIGDRMLGAVLDGSGLDRVRAAEERRGSLPPGPLRARTLEKISGDVASLTSNLDTSGRRSHQVGLDLGGVRLTGVVTGMVGSALEVRTFSKVSAKHVLGAWIDLLAVAAANPAVAPAAALHGRKGNVTLKAPEPDEARHLLGQLISYRDKGLQSPLGIPPKTASAYAWAVRNAPDLRDRGAIGRGYSLARTIWEGDKFAGENDNHWWQRVLGKGSTIEQLDGNQSLRYWAPLVWQPIHDHGGHV